MRYKLRYIEQVFKNIILGNFKYNLNSDVNVLQKKQCNSKQMRSVILGRAYDINSGNFNVDEVLDGLGLTAHNLFPIAIILPHTAYSSAITSSGGIPKIFNVGKWDVPITMAFLCTENYDNNNQIADVNRNTNTSQHALIDYWDDMWIAAEDFCRQLLTITNLQSTTAGEYKHIQIVGNDQSNKAPFEILFLDKQGNKRLAGVLLKFTVSLPMICDVSDYDNIPLTNSQLPPIIDNHHIHQHGS